MGWFSFLSGGAGDGVKKVTEGIGSLAVDLRTAITGVDAKKKAELEAFIEKAEHLARQGQIETNKLEAAHRSVFVAGWRPGIGWVCAVSLGCYYIPQYTLGAYLWFRASLAASELLPFPISADGLLELVMALLGMGILRTVEKKQNVQDKH